MMHFAPLKVTLCSKLSRRPKPLKSMHITKSQPLKACRVAACLVAACITSFAPGNHFRKSGNILGITTVTSLFFPFSQCHRAKEAPKASPSGLVCPTMTMRFAESTKLCHSLSCCESRYLLNIYLSYIIILVFFVDLLY